MMDRNTQAALAFAPPGHFYSPHPDLDQVEADAHHLFDRSPPASLPGIDLNAAGQLALLARFSAVYGELPWSDAPSASLRYGFANDFFGHGDAIALYGMMRVFKPKRIIEIGSGFSSGAMLDVIEQFLGGQCELTCIEPYPERLRSRLRADDEGTRLTILEHNLQDVDPGVFAVLDANDILFVDSSHVSKTGSDVNQIVFELLPRLRPGVIVHFHDIFYPFEYPKDWVLGGRAWNEDYLLRAFLQFNSAFPILFFNDFLHRCHATEIKNALPLSARNPGGSLWLQSAGSKQPASIRMSEPADSFEHAGWGRIANSDADLDKAEAGLAGCGLTLKDLDLASYAQAFERFLDQPAYQGEYRFYGGLPEHCLLEKALEHFISFQLVNPAPGATGVDIGSCSSVVPAMLREQFGCQCYEQDLAYAPGVHGNTIGSSADSIPLPGRSVDFMTLHCTFEHFEGHADTGFIQECARLLKPGGSTVILPLYLNGNFCNVTGETDRAQREQIGFDPDARYHCVIPEWQNRFGRHYSPEALEERVIAPGLAAGLQGTLYRVRNWAAIHPDLWLRWILLWRQL